MQSSEFEVLMNNYGDENVLG